MHINDALRIAVTAEGKIRESLEDPMRLRRIMLAVTAAMMAAVLAGVPAVAQTKRAAKPPAKPAAAAAKPAATLIDLNSASKSEL